VFDKYWKDNSPFLPPACAVVPYGLGEHPFRRWSGGRPSLFQQLLDEGFTPRLAGALREEPFDAEGPAALLCGTGWYRFGTSLRQGVYRVAVARRAGAPHDHLTPRELGVAELGARGWKSHRIGAELSIAAPTARGAIDRCVIKLGMASSVQLPLLWYTLGSEGRCLLGASGTRYRLFTTPLWLLTEALTPVERELVEHLLAGDTQRATAQHRGVSVHTVANQMSRLFEKLDVSSRTELVARLLELGRAR
jgi:DNA-binding NarL/FixJ family response regulator